jgi:hypothetical protein
MIFSLIITRDFCLLAIKAIALLPSSLTFWLADALSPKEIDYFYFNDRKVSISGGVFVIFSGQLIVESWD